MTSSAVCGPHAAHDLTALIAVLVRNSEAGGLRKFLELYRLKVLAEYIRPEERKCGELLIGQGEPDRKLYFVESGDLKVDMHTEGGIIHLAIVGSGSVALALAMALGTLLSARMMDLSKRVTVF